MLPIVYENHCQACHPLTVERNGFDDPKLGHLTVPHRWQTKEIRGFLENYVTAQIARDQLDFLEKKVVRPLPGKLTDLLPPAAGALIDQKVKAAETHLYATQQSCALCHEFTKPYDPREQVSDLRIEPTKVPQGCHEPVAKSGRSQARYCCPACRQAVRRVVDRERKWQFRGTFRGRRAREQEYQAARARRGKQQHDSASARSPRPPPP